MRNILSQLLALGPELAVFILTAPLLASNALVITQTPVPSPDLDLSSLGRVALAGDFDSISIYTYEGQTEDVFVSNGSQSLLAQFPDGSFETIGMSDAYINSMCPFTSGGKLAGIILGGNFTSLAGMEAQSAALWSPSNGEFTALDGLDGAVFTVYCDAEMSTVYFGGSFVVPGASSMNSMAWVTNWTSLPFEGFNGPVNAITKNSKGNIVFGGQFDGLGNMTKSNSESIALNTQVVPLASGSIGATGTNTSMPGFDEPSNIICKVGSDGPGSTWLLEDGFTRGWWQGIYDFGFNPTKIRLYNTNYEGRGTKSWYFENLNSGGVLNMNYTDANGNNQSCSSVCPLPQATKPGDYQDFFFSPSVGMSEFRIWILDYYGAGGGLAGIEMFQDDLYSFAVDEFNEPSCDDVSTGSSSTNSPAGTWYRVANNGTSSSDWLQATITDDSQLTPSTNVIFEPNIQQSGNYSILMYTPGCVPFNTCATRGTVNVTGTMTSNDAPISTTVTQTNFYDKFDQIYYGYVDVSSDSFKPQVTLSPLPGQNLPLTVVAQRVRFDIVSASSSPSDNGASSSSSSGAFNGLYEFNPTTSSVLETSDIDSAGSKLDAGAIVNALEPLGSDLYVGGKFSGPGISNIMLVDTDAVALANGGLNDAVEAMYIDGTSLFVAGNFSNTADSSVTGLSNIALYDTTGKSWSPLGAGVNGRVTSLVPLDINITADDLQPCLTVTGLFTSINAYGGNDAVAVKGFAVWVLNKNDWLNNIPDATASLQGDLVSMANVPGFQPVYAGQISSQQLGLSDAVELVGSGESSLQTLGIKLTPSSATSNGSNTKRAISPHQNYTGVYTGLFYDDNGLNITVLGGQFSVTASNGSTVNNLIFINNTRSQTVTGISGLDSSSIIAAVDTYDTTLYAGGIGAGTINGNPVSGLIAYDLATGAPVSPQPPSLNGDNVMVNAIAAQPDSTMIYFGGSFEQAGSLPCATLCQYDASIQQWNPPGTGLTGTINTMFWSSNTNLIIAGDLAISGNKTTMATFDSKSQTFTAYTGASELPGPISSLNAVDSSYDEFWAAGIASNNGSTFLSRYYDNTWTGVGGIDATTTIRGLQIMSVTSDHSSTNLVPDDEVLMIVGNIHIPNYGNASAALFNGTDFIPFLLTNKDDGSQGSIASIFVSNPQNLLNSNNNHLALGLVVLIGLAIALGLISLLIATGLLIERRRRLSQGYVPMPSVNEKNGAFSRVPPETLFGGFQNTGTAPRV